MTPRELDALMHKAIHLHRTGAFQEAENLYQQALRYFPTHPGILNLLGTLAAQQQRYTEALHWLHQALQFDPHNPMLLVNLAEATHRQGQTADAIPYLQRALALAPHLAIAHYNLANLLKVQGQLEAAVAHYEHALAQEQRAEYFYNYGNTLMALGRFRSARQAMEKALALSPSHAAAHNNLATLLLEEDDFEGALAHYKQALMLQPEFAEAWNNLTQFHAAQGDIAQAQEAWHRHPVKKTQPELWRLASATLLPVIPNSEAEIEAVIQTLSEVANSLQGHGFSLTEVQTYNLALPALLTYYGKADLALRQAYAGIFSAHFQAEPPPPTGRRTPRLGVVVTRGHEGVFLKCMAGLLRELRVHFDWLVVCSQPNGRKILEPHLPGVGWLELSSDLTQALAQLREAHCDLLYYWEVGTDSYNYFLPFFKPAPIQMTGWGWPVSSGIPGMDYYLSAQGLEPAGAQAHYSEKLLCMRRLPVFYAPPPVPERPADFTDYGLKQHQRLYLCTQNLRKVQPEMDAYLAEILQRDPEGVVFLLGDKRPAVSLRLEQRLRRICPEAGARLRILPRLPEPDYLALVKAAHVILDTTAYSGGANTNYDAFCAGTPVVTLPGALHRSRYTLAAYRQMGISGLVTDSPAAYVELALRIAQEPELRAHYSAALQVALPEVLLDRQAVQEFSELLQTVLAHAIS